MFHLHAPTRKFYKTSAGFYHRIQGNAEPKTACGQLLRDIETVDVLEFVDGKEVVCGAAPAITQWKNRNRLSICPECVRVVARTKNR